MTISWKKVHFKHDEPEYTEREKPPDTKSQVLQNLSISRIIDFSSILVEPNFKNFVLASTKITIISFEYLRLIP